MTDNWYVVMIDGDGFAIYGETQDKVLEVIRSHDDLDESFDIIADKLGDVIPDNMMVVRKTALPYMYGGSLRAKSSYDTIDVLCEFYVGDMQTSTEFLARWDDLTAMFSATTPEMQDQIKQDTIAAGGE